MSENNETKQMLDPEMVIGIFLAVFSVFIFIAITVTPTTVGKITNLVSGLVILLVAALFIGISHKRRKQTQ